MGAGYAWAGPDALTSHGFSGDNANLNQIFQGILGTAVKIPGTSNLMFNDFKTEWEDMKPGMYPWYGKSSVELPQISAQVYDAIAML